MIQNGSAPAAGTDEAQKTKHDSAVIVAGAEAKRASSVIDPFLPIPDVAGERWGALGAE